jgi:hypothetical protein
MPSGASSAVSASIAQIQQSIQTLTLKQSLKQGEQAVSLLQNATGTVPASSSSAGANIDTSA